VWLARQLAAVRSAAEPLVLIGGEGAGVPFVLDALRTRERVAWFELPRSAAGDVVAQGNALARAVNRVLAAPLLPLALPYRAQVQSLVRHRGDVLPLWLAVRCDGGDHGLLDDLLDLHHHGYRVLLDVDRAEAAPAAWRGRCRVLDGAALRVRREEARDALPAGLDDGTVERLLRESDAGFGALLASAQRAAGLPRLLVPGPDGVSVDERAAEVVEPALAVLALRREGDVLGALELAVLRAPHLVEDLLRLAGPRYQEEGLFERLHLLLSAVPDPYARRERVLEWRLVAAFAMNDMSAVAADVDAHLQAHAAPALRARRAGTVAHARGFSLAEAAYRASRTPLTLWQYGRLHPNPDTALELLRESVSVAEYAGTRYDVARNAATLASKLNHLDSSRARPLGGVGRSTCSSKTSCSTVHGGSRSSTSWRSLASSVAISPGCGRCSRTRWQRWREASLRSRRAYGAPSRTSRSPKVARRQPSNCSRSPIERVQDARVGAMPTSWCEPCTSWAGATRRP